MAVKYRLNADDVIVPAFFAGTGNAQVVWDGIRIHAGSGALPVVLGGTGLAILAEGDLLYANSNTSLARLAAPLFPGVLTTNGAGTHSWATFAGLKQSLGDRIAHKTSDTARSSTTIATADPDLAFAMGANETWRVRMIIYFEVAGSTPGLKCGISGPASPTAMKWHMRRWLNATSVSTGTHASAYNTAVAFAANPPSDMHQIEIEGVFVNGANSGNLAFHWAQNTSSADAVTVQRGSSLIATKL